MPRPVPTHEQLVARFWSKVKKGRGCWEWQAGKFDTGYGAFRVYPGNNRGAHVFSYELAYGPVPAGKLVHHTCENKACVNPKHLEAKTVREHGRHQPLAKATHCKRGHKFTKANTKWQGPEKQWRQCRTCHSDAMRAYEKRRPPRTR